MLATGLFENLWRAQTPKTRGV